jgi:hypothetical protein
MDPILVEQWLIRSCSLPLLVCVLASGLLGSHHQSVVVKIMDIIAQHSERWHNVVLNIPLDFYNLTTLRQIKSHLPNLQQISIQDLWLSSTHSLDIFSIAPQLRHVHLEGYNLDNVSFPIEQLTTLWIESQFANRCVNMLRRSHRVIHCSLNDVRTSFGGLNHVRVDRLESLDLSFEDDPIIDLFDALTLPALRDFTCYGVRRTFPSRSFISMMVRSSCSLQTLSLLDFVISDNQFSACLQAIPSLQNLRLTNMTTPGVLQTLNPCHASNASLSANLLPNLKTLECWGHFNDFDLDFSVLISLLHSRWDHNKLASSNDSGSISIAQLQSVDFETVGLGVPDAHSLAQLQQLVKEGMNIALSTADGHWL